MDYVRIDPVFQTYSNGFFFCCSPLDGGCNVMMNIQVAHDLQLKVRKRTQSMV